MPGYQDGGITDPILGLSQRIPPSNQQAEQGLIGALLANNRAYDRVADFLVAEHFIDPINARLFDAVKRRVEAGQLADAITLKAEFENSGVLEEVGGVAYLAQLLANMVGVVNAGEYGRAIHDAWIRRQLIEIGEVVVNNAFGTEPTLDGKQQIEHAEGELFRLATRGGNEGAFVGFEVALAAAITAAEKAFQRSGAVSGLTTGLRDLDKKTGGLHESDLVILAGRPGMGKTALATKIAFGAARALMQDALQAGPDTVPRSVAIFSLEMSYEQLATRLLGEAARVSVDRIRRGEVGTRDFDRFVEVSRELRSLHAVHRRHRRDHDVCAAHPLPAAEAHEGTEPRRGGLPAADAAQPGHEAGEPRAGDQPGHPGAEGPGEGAERSRARPFAAEPPSREPRG